MEEGEKEKEKGKREGKQTRENKNKSARERERERQRREIFPAFRRSKLKSPRTKVDPRNSGYAWVQKSWSFVKLREVGYLDYF